MLLGGPSIERLGRLKLIDVVLPAALVAAPPSHPPPQALVAAPRRPRTRRRKLVAAPHPFATMLSLRTLALLCLGVASAFTSPRRAALPAQPLRRPRGGSELTVRMGSMAKFGIFSPAVYAGKILLGDKGLDQIRGKGISLHSQAINEFCIFVGASTKTKGLLVKKAKNNGDTLGFLV